MRQHFHRHPPRTSWVASLCIASLLALVAHVSQTWSNSRIGDNSELAVVIPAHEPTRDEPSLNRSPLQAPPYGDLKPTKPGSKEIRPSPPVKQQNRQQLVEALRRHKMHVQEIPQGVVVTLPAEFFEFTAVELTQAARVQIRRIVAVLSPLRDNYRLSVTGYVPPTARSLCTDALDIQGAEKATFALEAAGLSRYQMHVQSVTSLTSSTVQCCSTQDAPLPPGLETFRVEILITD